MAITDFFRALSDPKVQDQLAAMSYAYGPQPLKNSAASRFATYNQYKKDQKEQALHQQAQEALLQQRQQEMEREADERERERKAREDFEERMRAAQLTASLPSAEADRAGQGPMHGAQPPPQAVLPSLAQYYADTGEYGKAMNINMGLQQQQATQQEAAQKEAMIQQALADPQVRQRLGPAAELILRSGNTGLAKILAPQQPQSQAAGAPESPFGTTETGRMLQIVQSLYPKYQAGTLTPEEERAFAMANEVLKSKMSTVDPQTGQLLQKGDVMGAIGGQPQPPQPQSGVTAAGQAAGYAGQAPLEGKSLSQMIEDVSGPENVIQRGMYNMPLPTWVQQLPGNEEAADAGEYASQLSYDITQDLQKNQRFPEGARKAIEKQVSNLHPRFFQNQKAYENSVINTARFIAEKLNDAEQKLQKGDLPRETREAAMAMASTLPNTLKRLGVHFVKNKEQLERVRAQAKPGEIVVATDEDGNEVIFRTEKPEEQGILDVYGESARRMMGQ